MSQDFTKKTAIVIYKNLESWQAINTVAHISAYIGNKMREPFDTGDNFITKDGKPHPRDSQYPIIVLSAKPEQMRELMIKVKDSGLLHFGFTREMLEMSNDKEVAETISETLDQDIEYLGIGIFGKNENVDTLTRKFRLWQ